LSLTEVGRLLGLKVKVLPSRRVRVPAVEAMLCHRGKSGVVPSGQVPLRRVPSRRVLVLAIKAGVRSCRQGRSRVVLSR